MRRIFLFASILLVLGGCSLDESTQKKEKTTSDTVSLASSESTENQDSTVEMTETEAFIKNWLINDNGLLTTYIKDSEQESPDIVAGRDALSESLGLWMSYALQKKDEELFNKNYEILTKYFTDNDGFVYWKISEDGDKNVATNALIDDIRIANILKIASKLWDNDKYAHASNIIAAYVFNHNVYKGVLTDFYDRENNLTSNTITLSYIDVEVLEGLLKGSPEYDEITEDTIGVLKNAPLKNGFYPKSYNLDEKNYNFDAEINIVDQAIVAFHEAKVGNPSKGFFEFIQKEMKDNDVIYGMYDLKTKKPVVEYESPAVYGLLIMYLLEIDEKELADKMYYRMIELRDSDEESDYYGGYGVTDGDTHIFDNIVPLISEQIILRENK